MVDDLNLAVRKLDGLGIALVDSGELVDPSENLLVPDKGVLWLGDPVGLVREVQETAGNTLLLKDVEKTNTLSNRETEVVVAVDNELGSGPLGNVLWLGAVPSVVVLTSLKEGTVELKWH